MYNNFSGEYKNLKDIPDGQLWIIGVILGSVSLMLNLLTVICLYKIRNKYEMRL